MKVLVTGGAGYVGSTLAGYLLECGHSVRVLDTLMHGGGSLLGVWAHPNFEFSKGDVRDSDEVEAALDKVDAVVHLAAIVGDPACAKQPDLARQTNLDASLALLKASENAGISRFVFASTCSNYGKMKDPDSLVNEESELSPVSLYAETKVSVENEILHGNISDKMCATSLRFATVYGVSPRMRFDLTVNEFTAELLTKKSLLVYGEQFWRPYAHVRDIARAVGSVIEAPVEKVNREVFNVGSTKQNFQKKTLVDFIMRRVPDTVIEYVHKDEDPRDYRVSFEKIASVLDYSTTMTVNDGIDEVIKLVRDGVIKDFSDPRYRN